MGEALQVVSNLAQEKTKIKLDKNEYRKDDNNRGLQISKPDFTKIRTQFKPS